MRTWIKTLGVIASMALATTLATGATSMSPLTPMAQAGNLRPVAAQQFGRFGPFATIRRAWEVANDYRARGCSTTSPFHNGDGYYVDVQC